IGGITATNNSKADASGRTDNFDVVAPDVISNIDAGIKPTGPVPVILLSFTATLQNNRTVLLNWQTTAEINNHYFDVERSVDGISFNVIGSVNGNGTTSLPHNYSLNDLHPINGFNYYRLRQVDLDGHFTYSNVEVVELKNSQTITAWYNNQNHSIQLLFNNNHNNLDIKLYASNGQLIKSAIPANNINSYTLNLPNLSTGVYLLQVISNKLRYSKKIFISQ
nr:T9SS type A sorting domain-containing protein [Ferruginibacter sp.]